MIESKIRLHGELTAFQQEASSALSAVNVTVDANATKLVELETNPSTSSDTVAWLEQEVSRLKQVVEQLEGRSKRQKIRILHIKEGAESGMKPKDFVAQLLMGTLSLDNLPLVDRAHQTLRNHPGDHNACSCFNYTSLKYGLQYLAKRRVSYGGKEYHFTDPDKAVKFAESCLGSW